MLQLLLQRSKAFFTLLNKHPRFWFTFLSAVGRFSFAISFSFPFFALEEVISKELKDVKQGWLLVKGFLLVESLVWKEVAVTTKNKQKY